MGDRTKLRRLVKGTTLGLVTSSRGRAADRRCFIDADLWCWCAEVPLTGRREYEGVVAWMRGNDYI